MDLERKVISVRLVDFSEELSAAKPAFKTVGTSTEEYEWWWEDQEKRSEQYKDAALK